VSDVVGETDEYAEEAHQPGSLVRVKLSNFVTYTAADFNLGPSLNMVIGPNGTGKSTLVCAICLGLGWDAKNLGRAKDVGEFVKHGAAEATIEIELAASEEHNANPVVKRIIRKEGNKSAFFINGRPSNQKEVVRLAKSFNIQIDNLCQFLPQDRVVEFAGLSPVALLKETLRAAAPEQMVAWHEELIELRMNEKRIEAEQTAEDAALKQLNNRQNATREDVERWHQRQEFLTKSKNLERCRPIIETNLLMKEYTALKQERKAAERELVQLNADAAPARRAQEEMAAYRETVKSVRNQRNMSLEKVKKRAEKHVADMKAEQTKIADVASQIQGEREGEKQRRQELKRLEGVIANIDRSIAEEPVEVDEVGYRQRRAEFQERKMNGMRQMRELKDEVDGIGRKATELRQLVQRKTNERALLDTQSGQQANLLKSVSPDTYRGWDWIQQNRDKLQLKGEIHGPPILTCSVEDPRYADMVESQIASLGDATAITFTNGDDQRQISEALLGANGLRLHQVTFRVIRQPLAYYRSPVTREELQELGFEGWALDHIHGPEPVLAMLCEYAHMHRTAYSSNRLSAQQHDAVINSPISSWIAGPDKFRVTKRREYGMSSTRVSAVTKARFFTDQPVDNEKKHQLETEILQAKDAVAELKKRHDAGAEQLAKLRDEQHELKTQIVRSNQTVASHILTSSRKRWTTNTGGYKGLAPNGKLCLKRKVSHTHRHTTSNLY
jgi:chromosome segregation ATPase